jgi:hypothetical protein
VETCTDETLVGLLLRFLLFVQLVSPNRTPSTSCRLQSKQHMPTRTTRGKGSLGSSRSRRTKWSPGIERDRLWFLDCKEILRGARKRNRRNRLRSSGTTLLAMPAGSTWTARTRRTDWSVTVFVE